MRSRSASLLVVVLCLLGIVLVEPASATSDVTPPVLHSVSLSTPGPFTTGDTFVLSWDVTDDSGVNRVSLDLVDSFGKEFGVYSDSLPTSGSGVITNAWANGTVTVKDVYVEDVYGNYRYYDSDGTTHSAPGGTGTHSVDFHGADFTVQGVDSDETPPLLTALSLTTPTSRTAADPVTVAWSANESGPFSDLTLEFVDAVCKAHFAEDRTPSGALTTSIDAGWANGTVQVAQATLYDNAGNAIVYHADGTSTLYPGARQGPTHTFLGGLGFATHDTGGDTDPPVLTSLLRQGGPSYASGESVSFTWTGTDASGIASAFVGAVDAAGKYHQSAAAGPGEPAVLPVDGGWAAGPVAVSVVEMTDTWGNRVRYERSGNRWTQPSCGVPSTHSWDLSQFDFDVQGSTPSPSPSPTGTPTPSPTDSPTATSSPTPTDSPTATSSPTPTDSPTLTSTPPPPSPTPAPDTTAPRVTTSGPGPVTLLDTAPLSWSASDQGSGVASYDVRYTTSTATTGFTSWVLPSAWQHVTTTHVTASGLTPGRTLCFAVRARDGAGNLSGWSPTRCLARPYDDTALRGSGWSRVQQTALYGGSAWQSTGYLASLHTGTVTIRRVALVATTCPTCGTVAVYAGSTLLGRISLVSSTVRHRVVLSLPAFALRSASVSVQVLTSRRLVQVDGLVLARA